MGPEWDPSGSLMGAEWERATILRLRTVERSPKSPSRSRAVLEPCPEALKKK